MAIATPNFTDAAVDELIATRRDLHMHPELGFQEVRTSGIVAERLRALGLEVRDHMGGTGVIATECCSRHAPGA